MNSLHFSGTIVELAFFGISTLPFPINDGHLSVTLVNVVLLKPAVWNGKPQLLTYQDFIKPDAFTMSFSIYR